MNIPEYRILHKLDANNTEIGYRFLYTSDE